MIINNLGMVCLFQFCEEVALVLNEFESFLLNDDAQGEPGKFSGNKCWKNIP
mgnify:CR=1 FL=1